MTSIAKTNSYALDVLSRKLSETQRCYDDVIALLKRVEPTLLQNDLSSKVVEQVASIGMSLGVMTVVGSIFAFSGAAAAVGLFAAGWVLSKGINRKVFGVERTRDSLNEDERQLLLESEALLEALQQRRMMLRIASQRKRVLFSNAYELESQYAQFTLSMSWLNTSDLSFKHRAEFANLKRRADEFQQRLQSINHF